MKENETNTWLPATVINYNSQLNYDGFRYTFKGITSSLYYLTLDKQFTYK